jgi:hypothetical protein
VKPEQAGGVRKPQRRKKETKTRARNEAEASDSPPRDLNRTNRRMRTRMSGGVGGERRPPAAAPYPDYEEAHATCAGVQQANGAKVLTQRGLWCALADVSYYRFAVTTSATSATLGIETPRCS